MDKTIIVYSAGYCPYCDKAKMLLKNKKLPFDEIHVDQDENLKNEMMKRSGRKTVPQIFIGDYHVGGCDDLYALHQDDKLDELVKKELNENKEQCDD